MATIEAIPNTLHELLRCPICRCELEVDDEQCRCLNVGCGATFQSTHGIPILLNEQNSVFEADTFSGGQAAFF